MPIKPENKSKYPPNWKTEIRPAIIERAKHRCEFCDVPNYAVRITWKDGSEEVEPVNNYIVASALREAYLDSVEYHRAVNIAVIVLTIAHLDHDPTNNNHDNLRALCQRCHNRYDVEHRRKTRKEKKCLSKRKSN